MTILESLRSQCLRDLKVQTLRSLWEDAKLSFDSNHYDDAIEDLTTAVAEIEQNVLAVTLLKRAVTYGCQGKFEAGIQDAYRVMKLAPSFFEGYFCAGHLLQLADECGSAVAVYTKGIDAVSGQCSGYEQLFQAKQALEDRIHETNTVIFKKLPCELLAHIFGSLIPFRDRLECMFTCHAWQDFFLEDLPRASGRVIFGNMSTYIMDRLSQIVSTSHQVDTPTRGLQTYQVTILPEIRAPALKNALSLLSQDSWSGRISYLDICPGYISELEAKRMLERFLRKLEKVDHVHRHGYTEHHGYTDRCGYVEYMLKAVTFGDFPNKLWLANDTMFITTYHGTRVASDSHEQYRINQGGNTLMKQQQMINVERHWDMYQQPIDNPLQDHHMALKRLELVCVRTSCFLSCSFWEQLPKLKHISIKNPIDNHGHLRSIAQNISKCCLELETFRYGTGWEDTFYNKNDIISVVEDAQEQEGGIREIVVRAPRDADVVSEGRMNNAMIVPSLLSENNNCSKLTVLALQMETLGATDLHTLLDLHLPHLREFQLHQYYYVESYTIRPSHFASVSRNFPALEKIVLNNVQACDDTVFELSKAQKLRYAYLRVINISHMDREFGAQRDVAFDQPVTETRNAAARRTSNRTRREAAARRTRRGAVAGGPLPHTAVHNHCLDPYYDTGLNVYTKFIMNSTMLTEVCLCGPTVQDADLYFLVANNCNLSTVNLIYCRSLTSDGIASAFNYARDGTLPSGPPSNIHRITLANMTIATETVVSSLAGLPSLRRLTIIERTDQDNGDSIAVSLSSKQSRKSALQVYYLHDFTSAKEGILYECVPGRQSVMTRSVPSVPIMQHIADFL